MKRRIAVLAAVFALAGCGDKTDKADKDTGKDDKKQEASADAETPGEDVPVFMDIMIFWRF